MSAIDDPLPNPGPWTARWMPELEALCAAIRDGVRAAMAGARAGSAQRDEVARVVGHGAGDVTFAIDGVGEGAAEAWLERVAARGPISLLTEDAGWRHRGPRPGGGTRELDGFDHGGPRLVLDPIDGTRPLMHDLRPAWVVLGGAGPGAGAPRLADLDLGILAEIPDTRGGRARVLRAVRGAGAEELDVELATGATLPARPVRVDDDGRVDRGHFPFFGYTPEGRAQAQALAREVYRALPHVDGRTVLDDQYCSSGGQFALLALGTYRAVVDARPELNALYGAMCQCAKPYDVAGAIVVAREAGCVVEAPGGGALDMPMDATTPVGFAAYHNGATARALAPALRAALAVSPRAAGG